MTTKHIKGSGGVSRRNVLKGAGALAGAAVGSTASPAFPRYGRPRKKCCAISAPR